MADDQPLAYGHLGYVQKAVLDDEPRLRVTLAEFRRQGEDMASAEGYTLEGEPGVTMHLSVVVEDWAEGMPGFVDPDFARNVLGLDPDTLQPGPVTICHEWKIADPE